MTVEDFAGILRDAIGLDAASIGIASVERAVQLRMAASRAADYAGYGQRLRESAAELQALVEAVVVPETWFFRDPHAFDAVAALALRSASPLHFLCLPCATGEEPYSLAMTLLDAGVPASRFRIDACDVSERVLAQAGQAVYGRNSFRGRDLAFRDRHFTAVPGGHELRAEVRECVRFRQSNILDKSSLPGGALYDAIFCRNLLIYFNAETQRRAVTTLARLLVNDGVLCVGPAETGILLHHDFTPTRISLAFAFLKGKQAPAAPQKAPGRRSASLPPARPAAPAKPKLQTKSPSPLAPASKVEVRAALEDARRLADAGRFEEVAGLCHSHMQQQGASADAFYLLALVSDATGRDEDAAAHYRKALYLNPRHHEALLHYSLFTARRGEAAAAHALRERARRIEAQQPAA